MDLLDVMIAIGEIARQMVKDGQSLEDAECDLKDAVEMVFQELRDGDQ